MEEIKEFLINMYQSADSDTKEKIRHLLKSEVVDICKCPICGETFNPDENGKHSVVIFD